LDVICEILDTQSTQVGLLVASRKELDIKRALQGAVGNVTSLQEGDGITEDIALHVQKCLQGDRRLREWTPKVKGEIQETLVDSLRAHGMYESLFRFRWLECQLEALRKCLTVASVRDALRHLPSTLDATYDRIMSNIHQEYRKEAHCALQLLTSSQTL
jgi:hypothetical protein